MAIANEAWERSSQASVRVGDAIASLAAEIDQLPEAAHLAAILADLEAALADEGAAASEAMQALLAATRGA